MDIPFEDAVCKAVKYDEMSITEKRSVESRNLFARRRNLDNLF